MRNVFLSLLLLFGCCWLAPAQGPKADEKPILARAGDVFSTFLENEAKGDTMYGGKLVKVLGTASKVYRSKDDPGRYVLIFPGFQPPDSRGLHARFDKAQTAKIADLKLPAEVWIEGRVKSYNGKAQAVVVDNCRHLKLADKDDYKQFIK